MLHIFGHLWSLFAIVILVMAFAVPVWLAVILIIIAAFFVYQFKLLDLPRLLLSSFELDMLLNTALVLLFKEFLPMWM